MIRPRVQITEVRCCLLPEDDPEVGLWDVRARWQFGQHWGVFSVYGCLGRDGQWHRGWTEERSFTRREAVDLAWEWSLALRVAGRTARQHLQESGWGSAELAGGKSPTGADALPHPDEPLTDDEFREFADTAGFGEEPEA